LIKNAYDPADPLGKSELSGKSIWMSEFFAEETVNRWSAQPPDR